LSLSKGFVPLTPFALSPSKGFVPPRVPSAPPRAGA
jgi:hypothetical protein